MFHIAETREQARENVKFGLQAFADYFRDVATFPIIPPDVADPDEWLIETGTGCIGTPDDAIAYIERLLKGSGGFGAILRAGAQLGRLGGDQAALRADGALRPPALPALARTAPRVSYAYATDHHEEFSGQSSAAVQAEIDRLAARKAAE